jgi:hypothetical protein
MKKATVSILVLGLTLLVLRPSIVVGAPKPTPAASGDFITGRVTFQQSNPARSLWVLVFDGATLKGRSLTGDDGRYYVGGLEEKTYTIVVKKQPSGNNLASERVSLPQNRVYNIVLH